MADASVYHNARRVAAPFFAGRCRGGFGLRGSGWTAAKIAA